MLAQCFGLAIVIMSQTNQTPDQIFAEIEAVGEPPFNAGRKQEPGYLESYRRAQHQLYRKKVALLLQLIHQYPQDSRVPQWHLKRWKLLGWNQQPRDVAAEVLADIDAVLSPTDSPEVMLEAAYLKAHYNAHLRSGAAKEMLDAIEPFLTHYPRDERGATLLFLVYEDKSPAELLKRECLRRIADSYPNTHYGAYAPGLLRRLDQCGERFSLSFDDFSTGKRISTESLTGKVVVIVFWATTCPPCIAELPALRQLYSQYQPRGVEFIGVSLDESAQAGGRDALADFMTHHVIPWPQYYQGEGYESSFSKPWGVGSAPTIFVLDRQARLRSIPGKDELESVLKNLLNE